VTPPRLVAERLVYRRPVRKLNIQFIGKDRGTAGSNKETLAFSITDENGLPVPAALSVRVTEIAAPAGEPSVSAFFLLTDDLETLEGTADVDLYLSDQAVGKTPAAAALDLLLGTQRCRASACPPPMVYDNLRQLRADNELLSAASRTKRPPSMNRLAVAIIFGGFGLVLLVAMGSLLRAAPGVYPWIPAFASMACCLATGTILLTAERPAGGAGAAAFYPYHAAASSLKKESSLMPLHGSADEPPSSAGKTLFWKPFLAADADGRATVSIEPSAAPLCVTIDAQADGRLGSARMNVGK